MIKDEIHVYWFRHVIDLKCNQVRGKRKYILKCHFCILDGKNRQKIPACFSRCSTSDGENWFFPQNICNPLFTNRSTAFPTLELFSRGFQSFLILWFYFFTESLAIIIFHLKATHQRRKVGKVSCLKSSANDVNLCFTKQTFSVVFHLNTPQIHFRLSLCHVSGSLMFEFCV